MRLLIIHQNFPGQFRHMATQWAGRPGWQVVGIGRDTAPGLPHVPGLELLRYQPARHVHPHQHRYLRRMEEAVLQGQEVARMLLALKRRAFTPDAILAHPGWGETLYAKDVFPDARLVHFAEWFYAAQGADIGFDLEFPSTFDDQARIRTLNALHLLNLENCDAAISPTRWQKSRHPEAYWDRITVAHEGVDTGMLQPDVQATFHLPGGQVLRAGDPVVTYVARNLEPYRGFHSFMRALPRIQEQHRGCHAVIVGGDGVSYGGKPDGVHATWRARMLAEVGDRLDPARTHFLGRVPFADYTRLLQVSAAHVYLTYPFVLSWSLVEAMACGAYVVASDTAPVRDVLQDGWNGRMVPFFDGRALADAVLDGLESPSRTGALRRQAQSDASRFSCRAGQLRYEQVLDLPSVPHAGSAMPAMAGVLSPC
jgi:glycosyltransferase involved in cell wall biosynthesis